MSSDAIVIEGLGKQYTIGTTPIGARTLRESLTSWVAGPWRRFKHMAGRGDAARTFWALKEVSFRVGVGEVIGIVGPNGAGKSTLLKVLSRITPPTEGYVDLTGRVSSLLEVGTGFHPELTGRENVFLNGAILGMFRAEILRKFDAIVAAGHLLEAPPRAGDPRRERLAQCSRADRDRADRVLLAESLDDDGVR